MRFKMKWVLICNNYKYTQVITNPYLIRKIDGKCERKNYIYPKDTKKTTNFDKKMSKRGRL